MDNRYNRCNRRKYNLKVHIVLATKYRKHLLHGTYADKVKHTIYDLCHLNNWDVIAMETDADYIHILIEYNVTDRVCDIVKTIKQQTTYYLWTTYHTYLSKYYWKKHILWSDGYFVCSIGEVSAVTIQRYIENQG